MISSTGSSGVAFMFWRGQLSAGLGELSSGFKNDVQRGVGIRRLLVALGPMLAMMQISQPHTMRGFPAFSSLVGGAWPWNKKASEVSLSCFSRIPTQSFSSYRDYFRGLPKQK